MVRVGTAKCQQSIRLAAVAGALLLVLACFLGVAPTAYALNFDDPLGDAVPAGIPAADLYDISADLTPTYIELKAFVGGTGWSLANSYGAAGLSLIVTFSGLRSDGVAQTVSLHVAADAIDNVSTGKHCSGTPAINSNEVSMKIENLPAGCLGHFVSLGIAVQTSYHNGNVTATDRAPDAGFTASSVPSWATSSIPALYSGGHFWVIYSYSNTPVPTYCQGGGEAPYCSTADFGNPNDTLLLADDYNNCDGVVAINCQTQITYTASPGLVAVRNDPHGGLIWYRRWAASGVCCPGGYYRNYSITNAPFKFGNIGDIPVSGDWDGDGYSTVGVFRPSTGQWFLSNDPNFTNTPGASLTVISFGSPGDVPVVGDWANSGYDTPGVFRSGRWYELLTLHSGAADRSFIFGQAGDRPVSGDWNGDGIDTPGVYRGGQWYITNYANGPAEWSFRWGTSAFAPLVVKPQWWYNAW